MTGLGTTEAAPAVATYMRLIGTIAAVAVVGIVAATTAQNPTQKKLDKFDSLKIGGVTQVVYKVGRTQSVKVSGTKDLVAATKFKVEKGRLSIWQDGEMLKSKKHEDDAKVVVTITSPGLKSISAGGATKFTGTGLKGDALKIGASGAAHVKVTGTAKTLNASASGAGHLDLSGLTTQNADVHASGAGHVRVHVFADLNATVSGAASVVYSGFPASVHTKKSGVGSVKQSK